MSRLFIMFCMNHFRPNNRRHSCIRCRGASCYLLSRIWSTIQAAKEENWSQTRGKKEWRQRNMNYWTIKCLCLNILLKFNKLIDLGFFGENKSIKFDFTLNICLFFCKRWNISKSFHILCFRYHWCVWEVLQTMYRKFRQVKYTKTPYVVY